MEYFVKALPKVGEYLNIYVEEFPRQKERVSLGLIFIKWCFPDIEVSMTTEEKDGLDIIADKLLWKTQTMNLP